MKWSPEDFQTTKATWLADRVLDGTMDFALWSDYFLPWSVLHERRDLWLALGGQPHLWDEAHQALALLKLEDLLGVSAQVLLESLLALFAFLPNCLDFFALKQEGQRLLQVLEQLNLRCLFCKEPFFEEMEVLLRFLNTLNLLSPSTYLDFRLSWAQTLADWSSAATDLASDLTSVGLGADEPERQTWRYHRLAVYYFRAGLPQQGLTALQESLALNPSFTENYVYLTRYYRLLGDEAMAKLQLDIAKSLGEQSQIPTLYFVEYTHCTWQFTQTAESELLEDILRERSWSEAEILAEGYALLAEIYEHLGDYPRAWRSHLAVLKHRPVDLPRLERLLALPQQADWEAYHGAALRYLQFFPKAADFRYRWANHLASLTGEQAYVLEQVKFILAFELEHELGLVYPELKAEAEAQGQALRLRARFQTWPLDHFEQAEDEPDEDWDLSLGGAAPQEP